MWTGRYKSGSKQRGALPIGLIAAALGLTPLAASMASTNTDDAAPLEAVAASAEIMPLTETPEPQTAEAVIDRPAAASLGRGTASYYASRFHGRRTASGEAFDNGAMTAAHRTLPFGSLVRVTNPDTGQSVTVRINDRGPFGRDRVIDVSRAAADEIGLLARGHAEVELELIEG